MWNNRRRFFFILTLVFACVHGFCLEKRSLPLSLKVSVVIPCHYKHAQYLPHLLQAFSEQSTPPDEVVISLSQCNKVDVDIIEAINATTYPFSLRLITFKKAISEGGNRNHGCAHATGDVFICHDADDLPHPQRVEAIKYFFEFYHIDHLMHRWGDEIEHLPHFTDFEKMRWFHLPKYTNEPLGAGGYTNGPVAISRRVFDSIHWDSAFRLGVDVDFNRKAYSYFPNTIVLEESLYVYRHKLSTYRK